MVVVLVVLLAILVLNWVLTVEGLRVAVVRHALVHHVGRNLTVTWESVAVGVLGLWRQVLVWVEAS